MTSRGKQALWTALVRPHLEYGAEVMCTLGDEKWDDLELMQRKAGRWILGCGNRLPNDHHR